MGVNAGLTLMTMEVAWKRCDVTIVTRRVQSQIDRTRMIVDIASAWTEPAVQNWWRIQMYQSSISINEENKTQTD